MRKRIILSIIATLFTALVKAQSKPFTPNLIVIFVDDLGYGDLGCYGHPTILTPNIDQMAQEGMKFTQFYVAASVCTPSRAGLLTGRYPIRTGLVQGMIPGRVLFQNDKTGLKQEETTIAEVLKQKNYATMAIGKWHLGHLPEFLPTAQGFDHYFGIPYSNDMDHVAAKDGEPAYKNVPLMRDEQIIERPAVQSTLTKRYTEEALKFIDGHKKEPFFLYLTHTFPHVPLYASEDFEGISKRGLYGDVVEEIDWSVGKILQSLQEKGIAEETLVIFTSDNGPWLVQGANGGSAGLLKDGKGTTWEGGMRVPMIVWWPKTITPNQTEQRMASTLDLLPTAAEMAQVPLPDKKIDGKSIYSWFTGKDQSEENRFFAYYRGDRLFAARWGKWKAHFITQTAYPDKEMKLHETPLLFDLEVDPSEHFNVSQDHPEVVQKITQLADELSQTVTTTRKPNIEAEALIDLAKTTRGNLRTQKMEGFKGEWGGNMQLWWVNAQPKDQLSLPIQVEDKGEYDLYGFFTRAGDYGIIKLYVNGSPYGALMDGYSSGIEWTGPIPYGKVPLEAGENTITIEIVGKDSRSSGFSDGYLVGIDGFLIKK